MSETRNIYLVYLEESWKELFETIKKLNENLAFTRFSYHTQKEIPTNTDTNKSLFIMPLADVEATSLSGFKALKKYRSSSNDYKTPVIFLCSSKVLIPNFLNPHKIELSLLKNLLGNPAFGNVDKAILYAECFFDKKQKTLHSILSINLQITFISDLNEKISQILSYNDNTHCELRKIYYETFVYYYDYCQNNHNSIQDIFANKVNEITPRNDEFYQNIEKNQLINNLKNDPKLTIYDVLEFADYVNCLLNGFKIPQKSGTHNIPLELFRSPIPFPLYELSEAKSELENTMKSKKIKLLLIDNKIDKFIDDNEVKESHLTKLIGLDSYSICQLFELKMLGDISYKESSFFKINDDDLTDLNDFIKDDEIFNFISFKDDLDKLINNTNTHNLQDNYALKVYKKITSSHFILLDFFLVKNTYLAFDFIKDISEIQKLKGDYSTIWYFITSAVYDSVVKYSQSGLLAEYYELAVVNAGDDPTNEKRQIIFVYKLLTFINARIKTFRTYKEAIENMMLNKIEDGKVCCCVKDSQKDRKAFYKNTANCFKCLENMQTYIKRYLTEYDNICSLFYEDKHIVVQKDIVELLNDTVTKFIWLPEADWRMIQHQIDFINTKLKSISEDNTNKKRRQFSCNFIIDEIRRRSEIY
jgi:hypothetical protein